MSKHDEFIELLSGIEDAASRLGGDDYSNDAEKACLADNVSLDKLKAFEDYLNDAIDAFDYLEAD